MSRIKSAEFARSLIVKIILTAVLAVFLTAVYRSSSTTDIPVSVIEAELKGLPAVSGMQQCGTREVLHFLEIDTTSLDSFAYYKSTQALGVDEIFIVKAVEKEDLESVRDAVEDRIASQIKTFESYGPEQTARLKHAIVTIRGKYLLYCTAENPDEIEEVFLNAL
ncbi:MAG: DUF4358 domain-containing protein [Eubacterium sp.]|nr:DUF4358 domain-containing protein [Eubacterium sp.]